MVSAQLQALGLYQEPEQPVRNEGEAAPAEETKESVADDGNAAVEGA
mgnify:CR=1 FL=1